MPIEESPGANRSSFTHLEAFGRLLAGISPWLELGDPTTMTWAELAREGIEAITDPASPDFCNFAERGQPLVDAAFLVQGLLRAPTVLWDPLPAPVKACVVAALRQTRRTRPYFNNWLLFSAMVETGLRYFGEADWDRMRIDYALRQHEQWYLGDGIYGDGPHFRADYYNSFVVQPMLLDISRQVEGEPDWRGMRPLIEKRAIRYAALLERMISPEGTFPPIGRSLAYRFGALQSLAQVALLQLLPMSPAQVRCAMTAVIQRTMSAAGTFDSGGWLRIGFCGSQPGVGEKYISTGSLYLCAAGLLPLGLPPSADFWTLPDCEWTAAKAWSGKEFPIDTALDERN
jgi:hypothetical protein